MTARQIIEGETPKTFLKKHAPKPEPEAIIYAYEDGEPSWAVTRQEAEWLEYDGWVDRLEGNEYGMRGCYTWDEVDREIMRLRNSQDSAAMW